MLIYYYYLQAFHTVLVKESRQKKLENEDMIMRNFIPGGVSYHLLKIIVRFNKISCCK